MAYPNVALGRGNTHRVRQIALLASLVNSLFYTLFFLADVTIFCAFLWTIVEIRLARYLLAFVALFALFVYLLTRKKSNNPYDE